MFNNGREAFTLDEDATFNYLYENRNDSEIGQKINIALNSIEEHNSGKLRNVFRAIDFNSPVDFGEKKEKNAILKNLLADFHTLDLRPAVLESNDIIGDAYEYMIANFASDAGKKGGEFFTPSQVSKLVARLAEPGMNDRIYDPACGSGGLLLKAYAQAGTKKVAIYGQEKNMQTWVLCSMNMFLHGIDDARIWQGDTLSNPQNLEDDKLMTFQVVVANPPFSLDKWDSGFLPDATDEKKKPKMSAELDMYHRFDWGVPPSSKGDYAFVLHMLNCLDAENGRMAVVLPHGVLFREASEGRIRRQIVDFNSEKAYQNMPQEERVRYEEAFGFYSKVRRSVKIRYSDAVDHKEYEKQMQNLLDTHLSVVGLKQITEPVDILDRTGIEKELEELGTLRRRLKRFNPEWQKYQ